MKNKKLPLIIFDTGTKKNNSITPDFKKQNLLLKGMLMNAGDVKQAAKYAGIKTMAEAFRTLDQLSLRKSFYDSLDNHDITLDYIVEKIKNIVENGDLDSVKLKALQVLLKTLGLDNYSDDERGGRGWEETLIQALKNRQDTPVLEAKAYEVNIPLVPPTEIEKRSKENTLGKELYDK
jgi:hypothetical protein